MYVKTIAQPGSTGNVAYTGVGFQGKAAMIFGNKLTASGNSVDIHECIAFAVSSSSRIAIGTYSRDNVASPVTRRQHDNTKCILIVDNTGATIAAADFVSWDADGFTLNWTTVDATARTFSVVVFGGSDISNVSLTQFSTPASTGNFGTTGIGFQPTSALFLTAGVNADPPGGQASYGVGIGAALSTSSRWTTGVAATNTAGLGANTARYQRTASCLSLPSAPAGGGAPSVFYEADFVSWDSDGFTLNCTTASSGRRCYALCFKGPQVYVGSFNQPTSTGNQAHSGFGFAPVGAIYASYGQTAQTTIQDTNEFGLGAAISSSVRCTIGHADTDGQNPTKTANFLQTAKCITLPSARTTTNAEADFVSLDSDGVTENWTTADATARQVLIIAFGNAAAGAGAPKIEPERLALNPLSFPGGIAA